MTVIATTEHVAPIALDFREVGQVCTECAIVVTNDDDTMLDPERADLIHASIRAIRVDIGPDLFISDLADEATHSLYRCAICGDDVIDAGLRAVVAVPAPLNPEQVHDLLTNLLHD